MAWRDRIEDAGLDLRSRIRNRLTVSRRLSVVEFDNRRLIDRMADLEVEVTRLGHELEGLRAEGAEVPF